MSIISGTIDILLPLLVNPINLEYEQRHVPYFKI